MKFKENDNIIMIAPPINGMEVIYADSLDEVAKIAPNILDVSDKDFYKLRPTEKDIEKIVRILKPKYFIPTSGYYRYLIVATKIAIKEGITQDRNVILQNGKILHLKDGKLASQKNYIKEFGDVIIDGFGIGDVSYEVIRERKTLAANGLITIALKINKKTKELIDDMNIQVLGIVIESKLKEVQEIVENVVIKKLKEQKKFDLREIQNKIRKRVRKVIFKKLDKEPLVVTTFYEV
jgi:ribonuclease J